MIATKYAKNATGAVTGVSRTCFSLGQAIGPLVSGLILDWSVSGPYMLLAAVQLSQIVCMLVTRTPLWRDPIDNKDTSFQKAMTRTAMPRSLGSVRWMHIAPHTYPSSLSTRTFKTLCLAPLYHLYHYTRLGRCMGVTDPVYLYCARCSIWR